MIHVTETRAETTITEYLLGTTLMDNKMDDKNRNGKPNASGLQDAKVGHRHQIENRRIR